MSIQWFPGTEQNYFLMGLNLYSHRVMTPPRSENNFAIDDYWLQIFPLVDHWSED